MPVILIAALAKNRCIGKDGKLPWRLPEDMKRFKELTTGNVVIMGRKTWESIPERFRPLPERINIVLTRQADYTLPAGVERFSSLTDAIAAHPNTDIFIIGGAEVYAQALPIADRLELTEVSGDVAGDAFFPAFDASVWAASARQEHDGFTFVTYNKK